MRKVQFLGLALWRGGVLLIATYIGYWALRGILQITDEQLEFAVAVFLSGFLLLFGSLVVERLADLRSERRTDP